MRKLTAMLLALVIVLAAVLPAYASGETHNYPAVGELAEKIKQNSTSGYGPASLYTYIWNVEMPWPLGRETWLCWTEPQGQPGYGTLDVQIRQPNGVYFLRYALGLPDYTSVMWYGDQSIPDYYLRQMFETKDFAPKKGTDEEKYIYCDFNTTAWVPGALPRRATLESNVDDVLNSTEYNNLVIEMAWLLDVIQYNLEPGRCLKDCGFYCAGTFCRFHLYGEPYVVREPTTTSAGLMRYECQRCHGGRLETIPRLPFDDVPPTAYYAEAVDWAVENEITAGNGGSTFGPGKTCTRAQIVTFLWRAAGSPESDAEIPFADVPASSYYAKAVAWAYENGITSGESETAFCPNHPCTRAQIVTMLWRANGSPENAAQTRFTDVRGGAWYEQAVQWAASGGITAGTGNGVFSPNASCTRAQTVTFLWKNGAEQ